MSTRETNYIRLKTKNSSTMISTNQYEPSKLPISFLHNVGMPGKSGTVNYRSLCLHITYDRHDENVIHVWASGRTDLDYDNDCTIL